MIYTSEAKTVAFTPPVPRRIDSVQYLRAAAALSVAFYHVLNIVAYMLGHSILFHRMFSFGVDLFFVISGFIMFTINARNERNVWEFLFNRLTRVVPMYWLFTLIFVPVMFTSSHLYEGFSIQHFLMSLFFIPYDRWPILGVGWTLNYELFFYALLATALIWFKKHVLEASVVIYGSLVVAGLVIQPTQPALVFYTKPLIMEFLLGMLIGKLAANNLIPASKKIGAVFLTAGILLVVATEAMSLDLLSLLQALVWGVPAAMILMGVLSIEARGVKFGSAFLILLGDASYSIYLTHGFSLLFFAYFVKKPIWPQNLVGLLIYTFVSMICILISGVLVHKLIERPLIRFFRSRSPFRKSDPVIMQS